MEKPPYEKKALQKGMENARLNIERFEAAIMKEKKTIAEYQGFIDTIVRYNAANGIK